jgi:hypothetical protein
VCDCAGGDPSGVFWERAFGVLGVGEHDNVYLVAFLSGCYFFYFFFILRCCSFLRCSGILD